MIRFVIIFLAVLAALFTLEMQTSVQAAFVEPFTASIARICAWLMMAFDSDVIAYGKVLQSNITGFAVSIESGCNGVEASIVLIAALAAYPAPWRLRLVTLFVGLLTIQALNILRIISLFYLGQWSMPIFNYTHLYLWPVLIMIDVLVIFLLYLRYIDKHAPAASA